MSSVSDVDKFPVQKTRYRSIKAFHINSSDSEVSADEVSWGEKSEEIIDTSSAEDRKSGQCAGKRKSTSFSRKVAKSQDHTDMKNESGSKLVHGKTPTNVYIGSKSDEEILKGNNQENLTYHPVQMIQWLISLTMSLLSQFLATPKKLPKLPKLSTSLCQDRSEIGGLDLHAGLLFMVIRKHGI
jgi:hypothetical protein